MVVVVVVGLGAITGSPSASAQGISPAAAPSGTPELAGSTPPPAAIDPEAVAGVARRLNCPLCQGYSLQDCPLVVCSQMRGLIAEQLAAGASDEDIIADFVRQYGPQVLNEPPRSGFHLVAWILPVVALLAAGALATGVVMRDRRTTADSGTVLPMAAPDGVLVAPAGEEERTRVEDLVARQ